MKRGRRMKRKMRETCRDFLWFYRRQLMILCMIITAAGLLAAAGMAVKGHGKAETAGLQQGIAREILRFHVIANSDSREDQALKLTVRDAVIEYMKPVLYGAGSIEETRKRVEGHIEEIGMAAREAIEREGYTYSAGVTLSECYFPRKSYGDCTFPAGCYQALRICIGEAQGKNWWCVLFPNLCFVDSVHAVVPEEEKQELKNVLTEEEYESLFDWKHSKYKITCRLFELLHFEDLF